MASTRLFRFLVKAFSGLFLGILWKLFQVSIGDLLKLLLRVFNGVSLESQTIFLLRLVLVPSGLSNLSLEAFPVFSCELHQAYR